MITFQSVDPVVLNGFMFYSVVVLAKMMIMSFLTGMTRFKKGAFANQEDIKGNASAKINTSDGDVERVRRCHLNDMENVYLFVLLALIYCLTGPNSTIALWHFRIFAASRIAHTFVYLMQVPQPARGACFGIGALVCASMILQVLLKTFF